MEPPVLSARARLGGAAKERMADGGSAGDEQLCGLVVDKIKALGDGPVRPPLVLSGHAASLTPY